MHIILLKRYLCSINNYFTMKTEIRNNIVTATKFYKLHDALNCTIESQKVFILSCERLTKQNKIGRYYVVFPSFKDFLKSRSKYKHSHEIIVDHKNNTPNIGGRLVFDFDIKDTQIAADFKESVQKTIVDVVVKYYKNVDLEKIQFIWSTSENIHKFSKHLTVKNLYFVNWIKMTLQFYNYFSFEWDNNFSWINSKNLIDKQIIRKNGSLRMVGCSKINGSLLTFDNLNNCDLFVDSLIRIYSNKVLDAEQKITESNIVFNLYESDFDTFTPTLCLQKSNNLLAPKFGQKINKQETNKLCEDNIYNLSFELCNQVHPDIFTINKNYGNCMSLLRSKPSKCILSGKVHENENAYLIINKSSDVIGINDYVIYFGCYRNCGEKKIIKIGTITNSIIKKDSISSLYQPATTTLNKINSPHRLTEKKKLDLLLSICS